MLKIFNIERVVVEISVSDPYSIESGSRQKSLSGSGSRRPRTRILAIF